MIDPARVSSIGPRALALALIATLLIACSQQTDVVRVADAIYRPPLGSGSVGVAYMTIESRAPDRIVEVKSPIARTIEIHSTVLEGAIASMRPTDGVDLPANTPVKFVAGGLHLMVIEPQGVESRETFPVTIRLESGRVLEVECEIEGKIASAS